MGWRHRYEEATLPIKPYFSTKILVWPRRIKRLRGFGTGMILGLVLFKLIGPDYRADAERMKNSSSSHH